ncbi:MAG: hypothetical protein IEMM0003_0590 [bacterium]|nr:MAG: hypothetical protein IEMM0003_0590 [bacterium]
MNNRSALLDSTDLLDRLSADSRWDTLEEKLHIMEKELRNNQNIDVKTLKQILAKIETMQAKATQKREEIKEEIIKIKRKRRTVEKYRPKNSREIYSQ